MQTPDSTTSAFQDVSRRELRDLVRAQLQSLLEVGDLRGAKAILVPVQPVDIAEAIEGLPEAMHALTLSPLIASQCSGRFLLLRGCLKSW